MAWLPVVVFKQVKAEPENIAEHPSSVSTEQQSPKPIK
jgi:hypothetical protein